MELQTEQENLRRQRDKGGTSSEEEMGSNSGEIAVVSEGLTGQDELGCAIYRVLSCLLAPMLCNTLQKGHHCAPSTGWETESRPGEVRYGL